jgi:hypothetical protein
MKLCVLPNKFEGKIDLTDYVNEEIERLKDAILSSGSSVSLIEGKSDISSLRKPVALSSRNIPYSSRIIDFIDIDQKASREMARVLAMDFINTEEQDQWVVPRDGAVDLLDTDIWLVFLSINQKNSIKYPIFPLRPVFVFVIDDNHLFESEIEGKSVMQHASRVFVKSEQIKRSLRAYTPLGNLFKHDQRAFGGDLQTLTESPWFCPNFTDARTVDGESAI